MLFYFKILYSSRINLNTHTKKKYNISIFRIFLKNNMFAKSFGKITYVKNVFEK